MIHAANTSSPSAHAHDRVETGDRGGAGKRLRDGFHRALAHAHRQTAVSLSPCEDTNNVSLPTPTDATIPDRRTSFETSISPLGLVTSAPGRSTVGGDGNAVGSLARALITSPVASTTAPPEKEFTDRANLQIHGTATAASIDVIVDVAQAAAAHVRVTGSSGATVAIMIRFGNGASPDRNDLRRLVQALRRRGLQDINVTADSNITVDALDTGR